MKTLVVVALLLLFAVLILVLIKRLGLAALGKGPWPFYLKKPLSQPEQVLFHRLVRALPDNMVLAQVQVSRVLGVKKGAPFYEWNNRINRLSYDFVVCAKDATVLAAIELDDKSHERQARAQTDAKKDRASADAGLRVIRWNVKSMPDEQAIQREFASSRTSEEVIRKASGPGGPGSAA